MTTKKTEKEPKPIKVSKTEAEAFQKLADRKIALFTLLENYGLEERLLWEGVREKYDFDPLKYKWEYHKEKKQIQISHQFPAWAKERLMK